MVGSFGLPGALWFLPIIFLCEIGYYVYFKISKNNKFPLVILLVVSAIISSLFRYFDIIVPFSLTTVFASIFFYGIGNISKKLINRVLLDKSVKYIHLMIGISLILINLLIVIKFEVRTNMAFNIISPVGWGYLAAIIGIGGILMLSAFFTCCAAFIKKPIVFCGLNTLVIMSLQWIFLSLPDLYFHKFFTLIFTYKLFQWSFTAMGCYLSICFVNKYMPWVIGKTIKK